MPLKLILVVFLAAAGCATSSPSVPATNTLIPVPTGETTPPSDPEAVQTEIARRIRSAMAAANSVDVQVDRRGVAVLSGFVNGEFERDQAVRIARETAGVTAVAHDLRVMPMNLR
jgi:osmotically-inducible protein OsmY